MIRLRRVLGFRRRSKGYVVTYAESSPEAEAFARARLEVAGAKAWNKHVHGHEPLTDAEEKLREWFGLQHPELTRRGTVDPETGDVTWDDA